VGAPLGQSGNAKLNEIYRYWRGELFKPYHGEYPFHVGVIGHLRLDIPIWCSQTGEYLGRPWATFLIDNHSLLIPAVDLALDPPNAWSCVRVLRIGVQRWGRLPSLLVTAAEPQFTADPLRHLLLYYDVRWWTRLGFGSQDAAISLGLFGLAPDEFSAMLEGTASFDPSDLQQALSGQSYTPPRWTLRALYLHLRDYCYEIYNEHEQDLSGPSPMDRFAQGLTRDGASNVRIIAYDEDFVVRTLPATRTGTAKIQAGRGIRVNGRYYNHSSLQQPEMIGTAVQVRHDPSQGCAYAYAYGCWVRCDPQSNHVRHKSSEQVGDTTISLTSAERYLRQLRRRADWEAWALDGTKVSPHAENQNADTEERPE